MNKVRDVCRAELGVGGGLKDVNELMVLKGMGVRYVLVVAINFVNS